MVINIGKGMKIHWMKNKYAFFMYMHFILRTISDEFSNSLVQFPFDTYVHYIGQIFI